MLPKGRVTSHETVVMGNENLNTIVVKQAGALHRLVVVCHSTHGIYHLDYLPTYVDFFVCHVYQKLDKSDDAMDKMQEV